MRLPLIVIIFFFLNIQAYAGANIWGLNNIQKTNNNSSAPYTGYTDLDKAKQISRPTLCKSDSSTENNSQCENNKSNYNNWYAQLQTGLIFPLLKSNKILIDNGSNFPSPENMDTYSVKHDNQGSIMLTIGEKINTPLSFIKYYTLGGRLQYTFANNLDGSIMQYSDPMFLNYNYNWKLSNFILTTETKLGLLDVEKVSLYINGGLGISFNRAQSYKESPLINVTPRANPDFSDNTETNFTYHIGFGADYKFIPKWLVSFGYEFSSLGDFISGKGATTWANESLKLRSYKTNTILFGVTHFIN